MVTIIENAAIPIPGVGHSKHPRQGYLPGEYRNLVNAEILENGLITQRRPVGTVHNANYDPVAAEWRNMDGFVGHYKDYAVVAGLIGHKMIKADGSQTIPLWDPTQLNTGLTTGSPNFEWRKIVAFHRYNKNNFWITVAYYYNGGSNDCDVEYAVYWGPDPVGGDLRNVVFSTLNKVVIVRTVNLTLKLDIPSNGPQTGNSLVEPDHPNVVNLPEEFPLFRTSFIHKDRLWLVCHDKMYFSKTGNFNEWVAPDGGMYNFLEWGINDAVALKDTVYVACNNSMFALTYTSDPNTNATLKQLSDSQGGDSVVVCGESTFFAKDDALYNVTDQTITKVMDLNLDNVEQVTDNSPYSWRLHTMGHYIVACQVQWQHHSSNVFPSWTRPNPKGGVSHWQALKGYHRICANYNGAEPATNDTQQYSVFFINTRNGAIHAFSIMNYTWLQDFYYVPVNDTKERQVLYFLTEAGAQVGAGGVRFTHQYPHYMAFISDELPYNVVWDTVQRDPAGPILQPIPYDIEITDFTPDGVETLVKRFRSLVIEGSLGYHADLRVAFDNEAYLPATIMQPSTEVLDLRTPVPTRIGLNQKSRSVSLRISRGKLNPPFLPDEEYSGLVINAMSLLWTPTSRAPARRDPNRYSSYA